MSKINQENQGMLKMLQDISILLKDGKRIKASQIREKTGLELKYWVKLRNNHLIVDDGKSCNRPIYKWDTIKPNIHMAIETLKDMPDYEPLSKPDTNYKIEVFDKVSKINLRKDIHTTNSIFEEPISHEIFEQFWDLYDKKVGDKTKIFSKWCKLSKKDKRLIFAFIPKYKEAQPDKMYRKDPITFLNNKSWNDEIINRTYIKAPTPPTNKYTSSNLTPQQHWDEIKRAGYVIENGNLVKKLT